MNKQIAMIWFLLLIVPTISNADDSDRIALLEKKIHELELRLSKLETLFTDTTKASKSASSIDGWKSVLSWRKLSNDMSNDDVRKILGEPHRVNGGSITTSYYKNRGTVMFYEGKVSQWMEPRE